MIQIQTYDFVSKIYRAQTASGRSLKFKFYHDYRLGGRLKIFDFTERIIHSTQHKKLIITRLNQFTKELEIHVSEFSQIEDMLNSQDLIDESITEIKITQKEQMELQQFNKLVSINVQNEKFLVVMTDSIISYHMESLITDSGEKAYPIQQIFFHPIRISLSQYISIYSKDKIYLFLKNASYKSETNEIIINYTLIDLKNKDAQQQNKKIKFGSRKVVQATETMLTYIQKAKIEDDYIQLTVFTQYKSWCFKQKVFYSNDQTHVENYEFQAKNFDCDSIERFSNNQCIKKTSKAAIEIIVN